MDALVQIEQESVEAAAEAEAAQKEASVFARVDLLV